jgi:hypothetical protein
MPETLKSITWEAPEHNHMEKSGDWFFAFTVIFVAMVLSAILLGNVLFALLLAIAGLTLAISASRRPEIVPYAVTLRGVRIHDDLFPYTILEAYYIDEEDPKGPQLLLRSNRFFMPLLVFPLPEDHIDDIEDILRERLPEEHLEESVFVKVLELFGL